MGLPLIGVTTHGPDEKELYYTSRFYVDSIRRASGLPLLIAPGEKRVDQLLHRLDGLLFTGGGDIDPVHYGGDHHDSVYGVNPIRDESEFALARLAVERKVPTLAVCRGMQIFNVMLGGTLVIDLENSSERKVIHRLPEFQPSLHKVNLGKDSVLSSLLESNAVMVASVHHQAIDKLAEGAKVTAFAADGVIEAIEFETIPHLIAVQWHPELTAEKDPIQQTLFDNLVSMAVNTTH